MGAEVDVSQEFRTPAHGAHGPADQPVISVASCNCFNRALYQKYLNGTGNLAAKPGYSNHQNGNSMDIGSVNGYGTKAFNWLKNNADKYGFKNDVAGEFWHWTYKGGGRA
jgi:LAS superfamily LD-carboxypeptidase LdcB